MLIIIDLKIGAKIQTISDMTKKKSDNYYFKFAPKIRKSTFLHFTFLQDN